jgi:hypothetical protein
MGTSRTQGRAPHNQSLFRDVNDRIREMSEKLAQTDPGDFICECLDVSCTLRIALTRDEYSALREDPNRFAVAADGSHVSPVERVVQKTDRYWVVEKLAAAAEPTDGDGEADARTAA